MSVLSHDNYYSRYIDPLTNEQHPQLLYQHNNYASDLLNTISLAINQEEPLSIKDIVGKNQQTILPTALDK